MDKCEKCGFLECRCPDHVAQKRALCLLCGTELLGGRPLIVADLRKLRDDMEADCATGQIKIATTHWRRRIEKILEDV